MSADRREIVVQDQGKIVVVTNDKEVELGIESPCCTCVAPVFRLNLFRARALRAALTDAIVNLVGTEAKRNDSIEEEAE
jgi:hypothetical protein